ncbi:MAG: 5'-nucleotidase C-terminal domain-containing protein [Bacteroidetes bacterium]|nr:5'-nucleotidase C-terminal domain-containing protein [Bacteroidota bacterium]HET6243953.1 5'-nucleotidase [Bacteroidia bacterium]
MKNLKLFALPGLFAFFSACSFSPKLASVERNFIELNDTLISPDSTTIALISPYKKRIDDEMYGILIHSEMAFVKGQPESLLGNLVADLILKKANEYYQNKGEPIDFCLLNNGGLRSSLPEGEITRGKIFELMPFENELVVLTLSGEKVKMLFNYIASAEGMPVSGIKMGILKSKAVNILINEIPFDENKTYKVVTSDYLAAGGDKMSFFNEPVRMENLNKKLRDAIIEYMKEENGKGNRLKSKLDQRIYHEQ